MRFRTASIHQNPWPPGGGLLNRAWEDVMVVELALDESSQSQPLLNQLVNAKLSRCAEWKAWTRRQSG